MYHPKLENMANVQVQVDFVVNKLGGQSLVLGGYMYMVSTLIILATFVNICKQF